MVLAHDYVDTYMHYFYGSIFIRKAELISWRLSVEDYDYVLTDDDEQAETLKP